jgi:hypothetical protein
MTGRFLIMRGRQAGKTTATIADLKAKAKRARLEFDRETAGLDCGAAMAKEINPRAASAAEAYNLAMRQLQALDPTFPKGFSPL